MKIDDLDIEPGEILKQLFAARRNLQRAEGRIEELELELRGVTMRRDTLRALLESFAIQLEELKELSRNEVKLRDKSSALVTRLAGDIEATIGDAAHGGMLDEDGGDASDAE
jgi:chromosome segregation ATPase